ncbi:MAG: DUF2778 domain-containing protein [Alphaproteobacteria bacterium]|nr:DUF2778 domain-containing protein [Alphaproteobacteria bacterium]
MAFKEYVAFNRNDYLDLAGMAADWYLSDGRTINSGNKNLTKLEKQRHEKCDGTVNVKPYKRADGTEVSGYERECPYPHTDDEGKDKKEKTQETKVDKSVEVKRNVSPNSSVDTSDIKKLKQSLYKTGHYKPDIKAGEFDGFYNEYPNDNLFNGIKDFQRDNGLKPDGVINKGGPTEKMLNSKYEFRGNTFKDPININDKQVAVFDGKSLSVYEGETKIKSWDGVSGAKDFQNPKFQNLKDKGPLPEGTYVVRQGEHYYYENFSDYEKTKSFFGGGKFPGGTNAWGNSKVSLEPSKQNNMLGRANFNIHGGKIPGSAGCIDLTSQMDAFSNWFKNNGKDLIIKVKY